MLSLRELYDLVRSLTKTEKRYFSIEAGQRAGGSAYFELYTLLGEGEVYDEAFHESLKNKFTASGLEVARKHLGKVLMRVIARYHLQEDREAMLFERYTNARLLLRKGFGPAGLRHITQGKEAALQAGHSYFFTMFCRLELDYGARQKFADWEEDKVLAVHGSVGECMREDEATRAHASLYEILLCRYWKNGVVRNHLQRAQLNDIILEEHQIVTSQKKETFPSGQLHLHFQSVYFMMTGDLESSLRTFYALDDFFQANRSAWAADPSRYIRFLQDVLETLRRFEQFAETDHFARRLESLPALSQPLKIKVAVLLAEHRLHVDLARGKSPEEIRVECLPAAWEEQSGPQDMIQWWFTTARACLVKKDYPEALRLVNRLLEIPAPLLGKINYSKIRVLNLMVHHAMQNRDYLYYEIRSFERKMKKGDNWHQAERLVVDYLKHWLAFRPFDKWKDGRIAGLDDPYEQVMVSELGLKRWLKLG